MAFVQADRVLRLRTTKLVKEVGYKGFLGLIATTGMRIQSHEFFLAHNHREIMPIYWKLF